MGIPTTSFKTGDLFIEYGFEEVLFRFEKKTARYFRKFFNESDEHQVPSDNKLLCDALCSGVLTTAERYSVGDAPAPVALPASNTFSRIATAYQRIRPYWLTVAHLKSYTRSGDIEVGVDGRLEFVKAEGSIKELLEKTVSYINFQPHLTMICSDGMQLIVSKNSKDYDFSLRIELKKRDFTVIAESSFYAGRSSL